MMLWSTIAPYFWPVVIAYLFTGIYYVLRDASSKIDRPTYLSNPFSIGFVWIFWLQLLFVFFWRKWHRNSRHSFFKILMRQLLPLLAIFFVLSIDFIYVRSL